MGFDVLLGLVQKHFKLMVVVGAIDMLEKGTTRSFILHYLYGSRSGCCPHLPDFQVPTHGEKIALVPILRNSKILSRGC